MGDLVIQPGGLKQVLPVSPVQAGALGDPLRVAIMEELQAEPRSIDDVTKALAVRGIKRAVTTIRHHVDRLKQAGLIDLVRAEEARGAVLKYYAANTRVLHYDLPDGFDEDFADAIRLAEREAGSLVGRLMDAHGKQLRAAAEDLKACPHCSTEHFLEYLLLQVIQRGLAGALGDHPSKRPGRQAAK